MAPERVRSSIRVTHVITGLGAGGAEVMLSRLLSEVDRRTFDMRVVSLTDGGAVQERIEQLGVPVESLGMRRGVASPRHLWRLVRLLREQRPDIVQTWMYHADLIGGVAARLAGIRPVVWNIRHSDLRQDGIKRSTRAVAWLNGRLSGVIPQSIVCCAESVRDIHARQGFAEERLIVIHNGWSVPHVDRGSSRESVCAELGLSSRVTLLGRVGRFHPQKDHAGLFQAVAAVRDAHPDVHLVLCGSGIERTNLELTSLLRAAGIADRTHLLGLRTDIDRITAALDVAVSSSSFGEGHPGVVGEAMAAGVPVVATDVGDSALLIGDTGWTVPPADPAALASAINDVLSQPTEKRVSAGERARQRIEMRFSLSRMVERYAALYTQMHDRAAASSPR